MRRGRVFLVTSLVLGLTGWVVPGASAAAQTVTTGPATDITDTSFTAHCSVNTSIRTQVFVKYGKVGTTQVKSDVTFISSPTDVPIALSSLTPNTAYYVQCKAYNSTYGTATGAKITVSTTGDGGGGGGGDPTPTPTPTTSTSAPPPTGGPTSVSTSAATDVTSSSFTAHCAVDTSIRTQVFVKFGPVGKSQVKSAVTYVSAPTTDVPFLLTGLVSSTAYYVECRAYNSTYGTQTGEKITVATAGGGGGEPSPTPTPTETQSPPPAGGTTVVGVGDMCNPNPMSCRETGNIATGIDAKFYLLIGDTQYEKGLPSEYAASYNQSTWASLNAKSMPAIGNHEIESGSDAGYCNYFVHANCVGAARWYAYDIDANWRAIVLDSNQPSNSAQLTWLDNQLAQVGSRNLLVYWHHARWRNSGHSQSSVNPLMQRVYAAHADIVLWGHDHMYTRWAKLGPTGPAANGFRAFTVGTGGGDTVRPASTSYPGTEKNLVEFGVLELTLRADDYSWRFVNTSGVTDDSGTDTVTR